MPPPPRIRLVIIAQEHYFVAMVNKIFAPPTLTDVVYTIHSICVYVEISYIHFFKCQKFVRIDLK